MNECGKRQGEIAVVEESLCSMGRVVTVPLEGEQWSVYIYSEKWRERSFLDTRREGVSGG